MPILLMLALQATPDAGAFAARLAQAKQAEVAATGPAYQKKLWDQLGKPTTDAYRSCVASTADKQPFTMVMDVLPNGHLTRIDVQPQNAAALCLAGQYASWTVPTPPAQPAPYPVYIDFSVGQ